jgi:hypothetical protein
MWMYITVFFSQLVGSSLAFALFTSIYLKNKTKGFVSLALIVLALIYSLIQGFTVSITMGVGMLVIIFFLSIVTYFILQQRIKKEVIQSNGA